MKKLIALLLALVMVMSLAACAASGNNEENKNDANTKETVEENTDDTATEETGDDEDNLPALNTVEPGKLIMATNAYFPPYEYYEGDKIIGIDAEIAGAIAKELGLELVISDMQFDSIITAVKEGSADFGLAGMTVTPDREKEVDFSISYASGVQSIIVKEGSPITNVDDLYADGAAYKVGVQLGTTGDIYATDDFGDDLVTQYTNGNEAIVALVGGDVDCVIIDNEPAKAFVEKTEGLVILETSYADEDYAACFAQDNDDLKAAVDAAILKLTKDGTIDAIIEKYIG